MFTDVTPDTVSMSTVVSADVGPVTAPGDIVSLVTAPAQEEEECVSGVNVQICNSLSALRVAL